ncbi:MAG TPA: enoyl-CoA hydratase-related protein [Solirubrobacteraceae bacterium]|nr:enoyl-CoA hydratase-related protein [Solirubrobacteraceae bacterium]
MSASHPEQLQHLFAERANAGDLDGIVELYEPDATFTGPDGVSVVGSSAIRARLAELLALSPQIETLASETVLAGDVALISNRWRMRLGGAADGFDGASREVARRQAAGDWLYVIDHPALADRAEGRSHPVRAGAPTVSGSSSERPGVDFEQLRYEQEGSVARIKLDRPERHNALSMQLSEELMAALERVRSSPTVKVLVLQGAGGSFCAGDDISEMGLWGNANEIVRRVRGYQLMADTLAELDKVTLAAVDGYAVGGGLELTMACDFVIATARSRWGMPEVDVGITPGWGGTTRLTRLVGRRMAKEVNLLGALHPASRAAELGLWNRIVADGRLAPEVDAFVEVLLSKNQQALRQLKLIIDRGAETDLHTAQGFEALSAGLSGAVNGAWQVPDADQGAGVLGFVGKAELWRERRGLARDFWVDGPVAG